MSWFVRIRTYALIVQWIEHVGPNDEISVRFRIGVHGVFLNIFPHHLSVHNIKIDYTVIY